MPNPKKAKISTENHQSGTSMICKSRAKSNAKWKATMYATSRGRRFGYSFRNQASRKLGLSRSHKDIFWMAQAQQRLVDYIPGPEGIDQVQYQLYLRPTCLIRKATPQEKEEEQVSRGLGGALDRQPIYTLQAWI